jgi:hypothetical protein
MRGRKNIESEETIALVREMTSAGAYQSEICAKLGWSGPGARNRIGKIQKALGLALDRHGPRCPELTPKQKARALRLLRRDLGVRKTAALMKVRPWAVRQVAKEHRINTWTKIPYYVRDKVLKEIRLRQNYVIDIAHKNDVSYDYTLQLAHQERGVAKFIGGKTEPPMSSVFPQHHFPGESKK